MAERILIAGCGFVGCELARQLCGAGHEVWGLARSAPVLPPGAKWWQGDLTKPDSMAALPPVDHVVFAASAGESSDERYRDVYVRGLQNVIAAVRHHSPARLCFVSSTAVYHQSDGSWVDEDSPTQPTHFSGVRTLEAERVALDSGLRAVVLRCAGIYGPGRTRLIDSVRSGSARWSLGPPHFTNRIHRDDVAGALTHLLFHPDPQPVYVGVDLEPAPERDVYTFLAQRLGVAEPPGETKAATGRSGGNKRCNGSRLRASGYTFRFPTFREGYGAMLDAMGEHRVSPTT